MKKIILFLSCLLLISVVFTACSKEEGTSAQSKVSSEISKAPSAASSALNKATSMADDTMSKVDNFVANYDEWTYENWKNADDEQKEACRKYFSEQISRETSQDNLSKIFGTNQDKKLSQIIVIQKEHAQQEASDNDNTTQPNVSMQPDPGHGAAAGY